MNCFDSCMSSEAQKALRDLHAPQCPQTMTCKCLTPTPPPVMPSEVHGRALHCVSTFGAKFSAHDET